MSRTLLIAGALALGIAGPAIAKPGNSHGGGHGHGQDMSFGMSAEHGRGHSSHGHGYSSHGHGYSSHGMGHSSHSRGTLYGYGRGGCPPGLAKKNNGCLPPGKAKKMYNVGQRYPGNYGSLWNYNQIPTNLRSQYDLNRSGRYYYGDGYLYQVDPSTRLIQQVVSAIVH